MIGTKNTIAIILLTLFFAIESCSLNKEKENYFEGKITYKNEFIIKTSNVDSKSLAKTFGKTTNHFFKAGNYLEIYDQGFFTEQLYNQKENKLYFKRSQSDTLYWVDCRNSKGEILKSSINKNKEKILGIDCDELVAYYPSKTVSFYYNPDTLKINPDWYDNFYYSNKDVTSRAMKSICLKYKIEYPNFIVTVTATEIKEQKLSDNIFSVPKDKILLENK